MSQANVIASFGNKHLPAACAAGSAKIGLTWPADEDVFSSVPAPYPSCRLHLLEDGPGQLEATSLIQVSVRIPAAQMDDWDSSLFRAAFRKALGFSSTSQNPRTAYLPCFDYERSDDPAESVGLFRLEQAGSKFWRTGWDGSDIRLLSIQLNLFNQTD